VAGPGDLLGLVRPRWRGLGQREEKEEQAEGGAGRLGRRAGWSARPLFFFLFCFLRFLSQNKTKTNTNIQLKPNFQSLIHTTKNNICTSMNVHQITCLIK